MNHRALPNAALKAEAVLKQAMAQHPINDQSLPQRPFTENEFIHAEHLHGGLQNQGPGHDDFGPSVIDRR